MSLTACMIVKNEELNIRRCLDSIVDVADEICIVDTGTTDSTIQIAHQEYGARTTLRAWDDDFSAARNASLDMATGDWILQIDADEELRGDISPYLQAAEARSADHLLVTMLSYTTLPPELRYASIADPESAPHSIAPAGRLFKNIPEFRFEGLVHESIRTLSPVNSTNILMLHYGYAQGNTIDAARSARNYRLCKKQAELEPEAISSYYYWANTCIRMGRVTEAANLFKDGIERFSQAPVPKQHHFLVLSLYQVARLYATEKEFEETVRYCEAALEQDCQYIDAWYTLGGANLQLGHFSEAVVALNQYLALRPLYISREVVVPYIVDSLPYEEMALRMKLAARIGQLEEALQ